MEASMLHIITLTMPDGQQFAWRALWLPRRNWDRWIARHAPRGTDLRGAELDVYAGGRR
jgi:hypothetical protein